MVDVSAKPVTAREAVARGRITLSREALRQVRSGALKKGDPLQTARIAGILAAKQTSSLIPLCHPLPISSVNVDLIPTRTGYDIEARVRTTAQTGGAQFWGSSFVAGPQGEFLAQAGRDAAEVLVVDVDLARSENVRRWWPFLRDRRIDAYGDLLKRYRD